MSDDLGYSKQEWREMRRQFEREVKKARAAWNRGITYVIMPFSEFIDLSSPRVSLPYVKYQQLLKRAGVHGRRHVQKHPRSDVARAHSVPSRRRRH